MEYAELVAKIKFNEAGLVPAIAQDYRTGEVLMLAYQNAEALERTLAEREVYYYSRSRSELWKKGATSGNIQELKGLYYDCDADTLLIKVKQTGVACHTGDRSCFFNEVIADESETTHILQELYAIIEERQENPSADSYTSYLLTTGLDKILKKVGEESSEVIIAAKGDDKNELVYELSDLVYHLLVLMVNENVNIEEIKAELRDRRK
jgi:phosphoribosyl-ATP pyrophosphohydrolase/phosphoribosyl-AMP cyclohydrolase